MLSRIFTGGVKMAENIKISESTKQYWAVIFEVIDAAGDYAAALKLYSNLMNEATAKKVRHVLDRYYEGRMTNLKKTIVQRMDVFYVNIDRLNALCRRENIRVVTRPDILLEFLMDAKRRRSYRAKAARRLSKDVICPLQDFEKK